VEPAERRRFLSPVVWSEGMHLSQHQFQLQSRFHQDVADFIISSLNPNSVGLIDCEFDRDALRNGAVSLLHARGVMPDGLPFRFPEDPLPEPLDVRDRFSPTAHSHRILLAIPAQRPGRANTALDGVDPGDARFLSAEADIPDETTGQDDRTVQLARKNFRLFLDSEVPEGSVTLPLARLTRDGAGAFMYDPEFIPPSLRVGASPRILTELERLTEMLQAKADSLAAERADGGDGEGEIVSFWLSHTVQSAIPPLRHHIWTRATHPEQVFLDLSRLAGALCTFSLDSSARELPVYDHQEPESCFADVFRHIRRHLDVVVSDPAYVIRLGITEPNFYAADVKDGRAFGNATWFLELSSALPPEQAATDVPRLVKVCSDKHIRRLVQSAYPGVGLVPVSALPDGTRPRPGARFFTMDRTEPCWGSITETRRVGVYVPDSVPSPDLRIHVVEGG
jgi:type VI secretion system protein ImpJ